MSGSGATKTGAFSRSLALRILTVVALFFVALNVKLALDLDANRRTLAALEQRVAVTRSTVASELESLRVLAASRLVVCRPAGPLAPPRCVALEDLPPCGRLEAPLPDPRT